MEPDIIVTLPNGLSIPADCISCVQQDGAVVLGSYDGRQFNVTYPTDDEALELAAHIVASMRLARATPAAHIEQIAGYARRACEAVENTDSRVSTACTSIKNSVDRLRGTVARVLDGFTATKGYGAEPALKQICNAIERGLAKR